MKVIHGSYPSEHAAPARAESTAKDFKTCPICGAVCFDDMEVCFGCLHNFADETASIGAATQAKPQLQTESQLRPNPPFQAEPQLQPQPQQQPQTQTAGAGQNGNGATSRHICSGKDGQQFEITISVKLL